MSSIQRPSFKRWRGEDVNLNPIEQWKILAETAVKDFMGFLGARRAPLQF